MRPVRRPVLEKRKSYRSWRGGTSAGTENGKTGGDATLVMVVILREVPDRFQVIGAALVKTDREHPRELGWERSTIPCVWKYTG